MMEWVTLTGAVIAALAGSLNLWKSLKDQSDLIYVKSGTFRPIATPAAAMYVVNVGNHPVMLSDYGFVLEDGKLFSIPWYAETEAIFDGPDPNAFYSGKSTIPSREIFAVGISFNDKIIGSFAITATQTIYRVHMMDSRIKPKILWKWIKASLVPRYGS